MATKKPPAKPVSRNITRTIRSVILGAIIMFPLVTAAWGYALWFSFRPASPPAPPPEQEVYRITWNTGGEIGPFIQQYIRLRLTGGRIILDGPCISACTLFLGLMPPERVCATSFAYLAFHSAHDGFGGHLAEYTRIVWYMYPAKVRKVLIEKGWDGGDLKKNAHLDLIYLQGEELYSIVGPCLEGEA